MFTTNKKKKTKETKFYRPCFQFKKVKVALDSMGFKQLFFSLKKKTKIKLFIESIACYDCLKKH